MATISKKVCDRCGKEIAYRGWTGILKKYPKRVSIVKIFNGNLDGYSYTDRDFDLCAECTQGFVDWLEDGGRDKKG